MRCYRFHEERNFDIRLTREIAYQVYQGSFVWSKKKPVKKEVFWPIGNSKKSRSLSDEEVLAFNNLMEDYKSKKAKNG